MKSGENVYCGHGHGHGHAASPRPTGVPQAQVGGRGYCIWFSLFTEGIERDYQHWPLPHFMVGGEYFYPYFADDKVNFSENP